MGDEPRSLTRHIPRSPARYLGHARHLTAAQRERLAADIAAELPNHDIRGYLTAKPHILTVPEHVAAVYDDERCVGFAAASERSAEGIDFTYIETLLVAERLHSGPQAMALLGALFGGIVRQAGRFPDVVAMKTYNPKTYVMMRRFAGHETVSFYPAVTGPNPAEHITVAGALAAALSAHCEFDGEHGVVRGGAGDVGGGFWPDRPTSGDLDVDRYFEERVTAADRLLCFVGAPSQAAKTAITRQLRIAPSPGPDRLATSTTTYK